MGTQHRHTHTNFLFLSPIPRASPLSFSPTSSPRNFSSVCVQKKNMYKFDSHCETLHISFVQKNIAHSGYGKEGESSSFHRKNHSGLGFVRLGTSYKVALKLHTVRDPNDRKVVEKLWNQFQLANFSPC